MDLDSATARRLYYQMLRIRTAEEKIAERYPEKEMRCPVHLCIGQEATAVGVCAHLSPRDYALSTHRAHGHYLAKGGDLRAMMAEIYGKVTGCARGRGGSMHLVDISAGFLGATPIVGSTIPIAVGAAFGAVLKGESRVTAAFFGEGATEEGAFHESLNFAALKKLPAVFVCENNLYSVYSPLRVRQPRGREVFQLALGHGVEAHQGDGNDVIQVFELAQKAVEKARQGGGPTFLEFKTYRWREHCGPFYDNEIGYRSEQEFLEWKRLDPLKRFKDHLLTQVRIAAEELEEYARECEAEMEEALDFAKKSPFPEETSLLDHIYAVGGEQEARIS